jgi:hypothetical protein
VLGAQSYLREGPAAMFQKLTRDVAPATFAHLSRTACLVTLLPQLPRLARRSWLADAPAAAALFDPGADLPELDLGGLVVGLPAYDGVIAVLPAAAETGPPGDPVRRLATRLRDELQVLRDECLELTPADLTTDASPRAFALADRYTVLLAAAAVIAVRQHDRANGAMTAPDIVMGVLDRLVARLGGAAVLTEAERQQTDAALFAAVSERFEDRRLFDLSARRIPG